MGEIIDITTEDIDKICTQYMEVENAINGMNCSADNITIPYFLVSGVRNNVWSLSDIKRDGQANLNSDLTNIKEFLINGITNRLGICDGSINANMSFVEIKARINYQYSEYLSYDEYKALVNSIAEKFDQQEKVLMDKFNEEIKGILAQFNIEIAPSMLNSLFEDVYSKGTTLTLHNIPEEDKELYYRLKNQCIFGSSEYQSGLLDFKNHIGDEVMQYDTYQELLYLLEGKDSDYEKALVVLANIGAERGLEYIEKAVTSYNSESFTYDDKLISSANDFYDVHDNVVDFLEEDYVDHYDVTYSSFLLDDLDINYLFFDDVVNTIMPPLYQLNQDYIDLVLQSGKEFFEVTNKFNEISQEDIENVTDVDDDKKTTVAKIRKLLNDYEYDKNKISLSMAGYYYKNDDTLDFFLSNGFLGDLGNFKIVLDDNHGFVVPASSVIDMYVNDETNYSGKLLIDSLENKTFLGDIHDYSSPIIVNVSGVDVKTYVSNINYYINVGQGELDYLYFLSEARVGYDELDKLLTLHQNGLTFKTTIGEIRDFYKDIESYSKLSLGKTALNYMKYLYDNNRLVNSYEVENPEIKILGKNISASMEDLLPYYDENNHFSLEKFINEFDLSESEHLYYNNDLLNNPLLLEDLNGLAFNDGMAFFNQYGSVNQGGIALLLKSNSEENMEEFNRLLDYYVNYYKLDPDDAAIIMRSLNTTGACTYADACNIIYQLYDYDNEKFEQDFGYPMINEDGSLNGNQLLGDLYIFTNIGDEDNSTRLILRDEDNKLYVNENYLNDDMLTMNVRNQEFYSSPNDGFNLEALNKFLKSKNSSIDGYEDLSYDVVSMKDEDVIAKVQEALEANNIIHTDVLYSADFYRVGENTHVQSLHGSGHATTGVGITENGFLHRSWGDLYYTPLDSVDVGKFIIFTKKEE